MRGERIGRTRKIRGVPGFLMRHLTGGALEDGTAWVKKYSESTWRAR